MQVWPAWQAVKVDDTEFGIAEGLNAGAWTVGVTVSGGNVFGLSLADTEALSRAEFKKRRKAAEKRLAGAGAHYLTDSAADLLPVIKAINKRLKNGERS